MVVAVIAVLALIAVVAYQKYDWRAQAADIVVKYDAIRSGVGADLAQGTAEKCADITARLGDANLKDLYAQLAIGFEAVSEGYRPVLTVCAKTDLHGAQGVAVARGAYDTLAKTARIEKGAVLTDTLVSFAVPLTDSNRAVCTSAPAATSSACRTAPPPAQPAGGAAPNLQPSGSGTLPAQTTGAVTPPAQATGAGTAPAQSPASVTPSAQPQPAQPQNVPQGGTVDPNAARPSPATASAPDPSTSKPVDGARQAQCAAACRAQYPHGNSRAYRDCIAACR